MSCAGLILAAGASSRMGTPKALLPLEGRSFLDTLIDTLAAACAPVLVVLGHHSGAIQAAAMRPARFIVNPEPDRGQLSSLQCGLAAVPPDAEAVVFTPVDHPSIQPATVVRLVELFERERPLLLIPRSEGRRGHPVCCARALIPEFLALSPGAQARDVIHRYAAETRYLDVDDPGILRDIDDRAAYETLIRTHPQ